jgi:signal transduction histidine kinase
LLLTAGIVLLVTRQVITPVRLARRVAERIASGRLEERMHVRGEDDIARLATSFNQMTDALQQQIRQLVDLSRVQRQFVSDVSHELRTPLTTVRMAGDVLHDSRGSFDPVAARARSSGGTGLGLAIALEDAQLHGGWLQVWGAPGAGAQFRLTVPTRAGDPLAHSPLPLVPEDAADESAAPDRVGGVR